MDLNNQEKTQPEHKTEQITEKQPIKNQESGEPDIDKLISDFEQPDHLNLTDEGIQQQEEDAEAMKKVKQQYQKFMKQMGSEGDGDLGVGNLGKAFEDLLKGLGDDDQEGQMIGKKFQDMFKNLDNPQNFQKAASELLNQFMDKSLLEEPLKETKQNYEKYFTQLQEKKTQLPEQALKKYKSQLQVVNKLLTTLEKQPNNKQQMIRLFSELQQMGDPPQGIAPSYGFF